MDTDIDFTPETAAPADGIDFTPEDSGAVIQFEPEAAATLARENHPDRFNSSIGPDPTPAWKHAARVVRQSLSPIIGPTEDERAIGEARGRDMSRKGLLPVLGSGGPLARIPRVQAGPNASKAAQVGAGVLNIAKDTAEALTSPLGVATLGTGALPTGAQRAISAAFAADMGSKIGPQASHAGEASVNGTLQEQVEATGNTLVSTAFAGAAGAHGLPTRVLPKNLALARMLDEAGAPVRVAKEPTGENELPAAEPVPEVISEQKPVISEEPIEFSPMDTAGGDPDRLTSEREDGTVDFVPEEASAGRTITTKVDNSWKATTPMEGIEAQGVYDVVDAGELVTSFDAGYDQTLQPRDRSRQASQNQIANIVAKLEPQRLGQSATTDMGAPVVDERNQVLSGNGRVTGLRERYGAADLDQVGSMVQGRNEDYRQWVLQNADRFGVDPAKVRAAAKPVLVRRVTDYGGLTPQEFARQSNQQQVLGLGEGEKAASDARLLLENQPLLDSFRPSEGGDVIAASNREFLNSFIQGTGDSASLLVKDGYNAAALRKRVQNALLGALMGPENRELIGALTERAEELGLKTPANAVMMQAPALVRLKGTAYDVSPMIERAFSDLVRLKQSGEKIEDFIAQRPLFGDETRTAQTDQLLQMLAKAKSQKAVEEILSAYHRAAKNAIADAQSGGMFGEKAATRDELIQRTVRQTGPEGTQADLPAGEPAQAPGQPAKPGDEGAGGRDQPGRSDPVEAALTSAIEAIQPDPNKLFTNLLWLPQILAVETLRVVRAAYRGGKSLVAAIQDGVEHLRSKNLPGFTERDAQDWIASQVNEAQGDPDLNFREFGDKLETAGIEAANITYQRKPNESTAAFANRIIDQMGGAEAAIPVFQDRASGLGEAERVMLGMSIIKRMSRDQGAADPARRILMAEAQARFVDDHFLPWTTELAQGLQALSAWGAMTPDGAVHLARRQITRAGKAVMDALRPEVDSLADVLREVNKDVVEEAANDPQSQDSARQIVDQAVKNDPAVQQALSIEAVNQVALLPSARKAAQDAALAAVKRLGIGGVWDGLAESGGNGLVASLTKALEGKVPTRDVQRFAGELSAVLREQMNRALGVQPGEMQPRSSLLKLRDLLGNRERLSQMWGNARADLESRINAIKQQERELVALDKSVAEMTKQKGQPFEGLESQPPAVREAAREGRNRNLDQQIAVAESKHAEISEQLAAAKKLEPAWQAALKLTMDVWSGDLLKAVIREQIKQEGISLIKLAQQPNGTVAFGKVLVDRIVAATGLDAVESLRLVKGLEAEYLKMVEAERAKLAKRIEAARQRKMSLETDAQYDRIVRESLKANRLKLGQLVRRHFTEVDKTGAGLAEKVAGEMGIDGLAAAVFTQRFLSRFKALAESRKAAELKRLGQVRAPMMKKSEAQKLVELSNLGAFENQAAYDAIAKARRLPVWTPEIGAGVRERVGKIAELREKHPAPEGRESFKVQKATTDLLNFVANQSGANWWDLPMAFFYANIFSGIPTHAKNLLGNLTMAVPSTLASVAHDPLALPSVVAGWMRGIEPGAVAAADVLKSGVVTGARVGAKLEPGKPLERLEGTAGQLAAPWKMVGRLLSAEDMLFFKAAEEQAATMMARKLAKDEGLRGGAITSRVQEILRTRRGDLDAAKAQAQGEGLTGLDALLRAREVMEFQRPAALLDASIELARQRVYQGKPYGLMGKLAQWIKEGRRIMPAMQTVFPVVDVVANWLQDGLYYVPGYALGAIHLARKPGGKVYGLDASPALIKELQAKQLMGLAAIGGILWLTAKHADEPEGEKTFAINGGGPKNAAKRKQWRESGHVSNSFTIRGKDYSFAQSPLAPVMSALGNYLDATRYGDLDKADAANRLAFALSQVPDVAMDQSFLSGFADLQRTLNAPPDKAATKGANYLARTASSFAVPNLLRFVDRSFDPLVYSPDDIKGALVASVPWARAVNKPALDLFGSPVQLGPWDTMARELTTDPVLKVMAKRDLWVAPADAGHVYARLGRELTPDEFYAFHQASGKMLHEFLSREQILHALDSAAPEVAQKIVSRLTSISRRVTLAKMDLLTKAEREDAQRELDE